MRFIPVAVLSLQLATVFSAPTPKSGPADAGLAAEEGAVGGEAGGDAGGEEAGEENEVELEAEFGVPVTLQGGDLKQDILFAPGVSLQCPPEYTWEANPPPRSTASLKLSSRMPRAVPSPSPRTRTPRLRQQAS